MVLAVSCSRVSSSLPSRPKPKHPVACHASYQLLLPITPFFTLTNSLPSMRQDD